VKGREGVVKGDKAKLVLSRTEEDGVLKAVVRVDGPQHKLHARQQNSIGNKLFDAPRGESNWRVVGLHRGESAES
jgi:hypothetical protein